MAKIYLGNRNSLYYLHRDRCRYVTRYTSLRCCRWDITTTISIGWTWLEKRIGFLSILTSLLMDLLWWEMDMCPLWRQLLLLPRKNIMFSHFIKLNMDHLPATVTYSVYSETSEESTTSKKKEMTIASSWKNSSTPSILIRLVSI